MLSGSRLLQQEIEQEWRRRDSKSKSKSKDKAKDAGVQGILKKDKKDKKKKRASAALALVPAASVDDNVSRLLAASYEQVQYVRKAPAPAAEKEAEAPTGGSVFTDEDFASWQDKPFINSGRDDKKKKNKKSKKKEGGN